MKKEKRKKGQDKNKPPPKYANSKKLTRIENNQVAGVCEGLSKYFNTPPETFRIIFSYTSVFGIGVLLYAIAWIVIPKEK